MDKVMCHWQDETYTGLLEQLATAIIGHAATVVGRDASPFEGMVEDTLGMVQRDLAAAVQGKLN